jgi:hypothetical protein
MSRRARFGILTLAALLLGGAALQLEPAALAQQKPKAPVWTHAFDLKCRNSKQEKFDKDTKAWGFEVFRDENNNLGVYINESGAVALAKGFANLKAPIADSKSPEYLHGLDLKVRKAGQVKFEGAQVFGLEVFRDENTGNWIYITEKGFFAVAPGAKDARVPTASPKAPVWTHGLDLKCREAGVKKFDSNTKVWSIEVFRDQNNDNLIYICETGAIAIVPGAAAPGPKEKAKGPSWLHGLDLKVRKGAKKEFQKDDIKIYGMEVFRDENNGNLIYITKAGTLAVFPGPKGLKAPTEGLREPAYQHGLDLKVREYGKPIFDDKTRIWGLEVFRDDNTRCIIYISEVGAIAALPTE